LQLSGKKYSQKQLEGIGFLREAQDKEILSAVPKQAFSLYGGARPAR